MKKRRLLKRGSHGIQLLSSFRGTERASVAWYLASNAVSRALRLRPRSSLRSVHLPDGSHVRWETYSSQLGPYIDVYLRKVYEQYPGFQGSPGWTVLDVGANIGFYALRLARAVGPMGHVYAFEPNPHIFGLLTRNIQANGLNCVTCLSFAVSNESREQVTLWNSPRWSSTASLFRRPEMTGGSGVSVPTTTLDDFIHSRGLQKIDILKMDTEGAETLIVQGGLERAIPITDRVVMQSHHTREAVKELLRPLGFQMVLDDRPSGNIVYFARPHALQGG